MFRLLLCGLLLFSPALFQNEPIPLVIGFYGDSESSGAMGMRLAVTEINREGEFTGADGKTYRFELRITENPAELTDAVAVLALPDMAYTGEFIAWHMPVFLLSPDAGLGLQNIQATVFRGMTDRSYQNDVLANYLVNELDVTTITVIGRDTFIPSLERVRPTPPVIQHLRKDTLSQEQFNAIPQAIFYAGDSPDFLERLIAADWRGILIYDVLPDNLTPPEGIHLIDRASWLPALDDRLSQDFREAYVEAYEVEPDAVAVAAYDLTWAIRLLITRVGTQSLVEALPQTTPIFTTQGTMRPADYGGRELIRSVVIYEILPDGNFLILLES